MASEAKTFKQYAKEAKHRMKTGFWQSYHEKLEREVERAEQAGIAPSKVLEYYMEKADKTIYNRNQEEEAFYGKVKRLLDEEGETANIIGKLTDKAYYDTLSYEQKQRYTLELSQKYRKALERYEKEKQFEYFQ
ncbi:MAG: hypothetical protein ACLUHK_00780 [Eubacteriales bacterium]